MYTRAELVGYPGEQSNVCLSYNHDISGGQASGFHFSNNRQYLQWNYRNLLAPQDGRQKSTHLWQSADDMLQTWSTNHELISCTIQGLFNQIEPNDVHREVRYSDHEGTQTKFTPGLVIETDGGLQQRGNVVFGKPRYPYHQVFNPAVEASKWWTFNTEFFGTKDAYSRQCRFLDEWIEQQEQQLRDDPRWDTSKYTLSPFRQIALEPWPQPGYAQMPKWYTPFFNPDQWPENYRWNSIQNVHRARNLYKGKCVYPPNLIKRLHLGFKMKFTDPITY